MSATSTALAASSASASSWRHIRRRRRRSAARRSGSSAAMRRANWTRASSPYSSSRSETSASARAPRYSSRGSAAVYTSVLPRRALHEAPDVEPLQDRQHGRVRALGLAGVGVQRVAHGADRRLALAPDLLHRQALELGDRGWCLGAITPELAGDVEQAAAGLVLDLERGVLEPEALGQQQLQLGAARVAVGSGGTSTCAESAGKPDVTSQTWRSCTSRTPGCAASAWPIASGSRPRGAASSSTPVGLAEQADARADHERGDEQRDDGVGALEAGGHHEQAGERGAERRVEVGEHVGAGALHVERAALGARERPGGADVDAAPARPTTSTIAPSTSGGWPAARSPPTRSRRRGRAATRR